MKNKAPSFQWYPKDCDTDENVRAMDDREFGFYMRCLNHAWLNHGLPKNIEEISRVMQRGTKYVHKLWPRVGKCFELLEGRYVNQKQELQRKELGEFVESRRNAAAIRWDKHKQSTSNASAVHLECSASASPTASAKEEKEAPDPPSQFIRGEAVNENSQFRVDLDAAFAWLIEAYPGEVNEFHDAEVMASVVQTFDEIVALRRNLPLWKSEEKWHDPKFVPKLENYLSKRQFKTAPKAVKPQPSGTIYKRSRVTPDGNVVCEGEPGWDTAK